VAKAVALGSTTKRIKSNVEKTFGILSCDFDNAYYQRVDQALLRSTIGTACDNLRSKYLFGRGFLKKEIADIVVNEFGETLTELYSLIRKDYARYKGCSVHVKYDGAFNVIGLHHVPFLFCRIGIPNEKGVSDKIKVHPDWAKNSWKQFKKEDIIEFSVFDKDIDVAIEQATQAGGFDKWNGQILYFTDSGKIEYPYAPCDSGFEDLESDHLIKIFKWRGLKKSFMPGGIFVRKGISPLPADASSDDIDEQQEEAKNFTKNINESQGADSSHNIIVVDIAADELKPEFTQFEIKNNDKLFELTESSVRENIIRCYGQPLVLHAIKTPGALGNSTEWEDAKKNYDEQTADERNMLSVALMDPLTMLTGSEYTNEDFIIVPITGLESKKDNKTLAEVIGVGGITSLTEVLQSALEPQQKINYLILAFGLSEANAEALVNGTKIEQNA